MYGLIKHVTLGLGLYLSYLQNGVNVGATRLSYELNDQHSNEYLSVLPVRSGTEGEASGHHFPRPKI